MELSSFEQDDKDLLDCFGAGPLFSDSPPPAADVELDRSARGSNSESPPRGDAPALYEGQAQEPATMRRREGTSAQPSSHGGARPARGRTLNQERYPEDRSGGRYFTREELEPAEAPAAAAAEDEEPEPAREKLPAAPLPTAPTTRPKTRGATLRARQPRTSDSEAAEERKLSPGDQRRLERNAREQRRSVKIVNQIEDLANMLDEAGAGASRSCKSSVLTAVGDYIAGLQEKNRDLEKEQCALVSKIVSIAAVARERQTPPDKRSKGRGKLDYEELFLQSSMPMALAALDGKFTACNDRFAHVIGLPRKEAVPGRSIFDLAAPSHLQHVFSCVGSLLRSSEPVPRGEVHGALAEATRVIAITLIRPSCFQVSLIEPVGVDLPQQVVG